MKKRTIFFEDHYEEYKTNPTAAAIVEYAIKQKALHYIATHDYDAVIEYCKISATVQNVRDMEIDKWFSSMSPGQQRQYLLALFNGDI